MRNLAFFLSLTFLLQNLLCLLLFCRKIWKLFLVAHFGFIFVLCILVDYSLFMPPSKERYKRSCPVVNLWEFFRQKPWSEFFCKRTPKKTLSDFLIFDMGTTTCFIANSLLSPLLHVKIHASVGNQRPSYVDAPSSGVSLYSGPGGSQPPVSHFWGPFPELLRCFCPLSAFATDTFSPSPPFENQL